MESWFWIEEACQHLLPFMHHSLNCPSTSRAASSARVPQAAERGWTAFRGRQSQIWYFHERQNAWFLTHMYYV